MSFQKSISGYRQVPTQQDDTLQKIALREMGDANQWRLLADLNNLVAPYITNTLACAGPQVLLAGQPVLVPASGAAPSGVSNSDDVYGIDLLLEGGRVVVSPTGDFATVSGVANLKQALGNRLRTAPGDLMFHPDYGCKVYQLIGQGATPGNDQLAAAFVAQAMLSDPRVSSASSVQASVNGDVISATGTAVAVGGQRVPSGIPGGVVQPISGAV